MWTVSMFMPLLTLVISILLVIHVESFNYWVAWDVVMIESPLMSFLIFDKISLTFCMTVSLVSVSVFFYSFLYMSKTPMKGGFIIVLSSFVLSMFFLIFSGDLFWLMVGWDGLGLSSMLLIFFFQNWKSFNSGMVTFLSNRMGDFFLVSSIVMLFFSTSLTSKATFIISCLIFLGAFSKSAQIPFSSWLPLAMAAPTPVSALVHSSTLVTAGIYLLIRFNNCIDSQTLFWTCFLSGVTLSLGGTSSLMEFDLKKIIALSTLSHIGLMMFFISMKSLDGALLHLVLHALFKSLLFMVGGCIIHDNMGEQDIRLVSVSNLSIPLNISLVISLLSMMGIPFFSGFYSKEFFLSFMSLSGYLIKVIFFFVSVFLTCSYSSRLLFYLFNSKSNKKISFSDNSYWWIFFSMSISSLMGGYLCWMIAYGAMEEMLFSSLKKILLPSLFLGTLLGISLSYLNFFSKKMFLFFNQMWGLSKSIYIFQFLFPYSRFILFNLDSKGVIDWCARTILTELKNLSKFSLLLTYSLTLLLMSMFLTFLLV